MTNSHSPCSAATEHEPQHNHRVYFACECCADYDPENGVFCRSDIAVMPDGTWLCDNCYVECDKTAYGIVCCDVDDFQFPRFEDLPRPAPYPVQQVIPDDAQSVGMREALALCEDVLRVVQEVDKVPESPIIILARDKAKAALAAHGDCSAGNAAVTSGTRDRFERILSNYHFWDEGPFREMKVELLDELVSASEPQTVPDIAAGMTKAMEIIGEMRMSEAGIFDEKHSGQRGEDRSNALYDAYVAIRSALPRPQGGGGQ